MTRSRIASLALLTLTGCAPQTVWIKQGSTEEEFRADAKVCEYEALKAVQSTDPYMKSMFGQELDKSLRRRDVGNACMQAKGYELKPRSDFK